MSKDQVEKIIIDNLEMCKIYKKEEYLEVVFPVVTFFNQQLITLRIYPFEDCYYISTTNTVFDEYEEYSENYCETYYNKFIQNERLNKFKILRKGAYLYKQYDADYSARVAVSEFIKFFILLDDFILENE